MEGGEYWGLTKLKDAVECESWEGYFALQGKETELWTLLKKNKNKIKNVIARNIGELLDLIP